MPLIKEAKLNEVEDFFLFQINNLEWNANVVEQWVRLIRWWIKADGEEGFEPVTNLK